MLVEKKPQVIPSIELDEAPVAEVVAQAEVIEISDSSPVAADPRDFGPRDSARNTMIDDFAASHQVSEADITWEQLEWAENVAHKVKSRVTTEIARLKDCRTRKEALLAQ